MHLEPNQREVGISILFFWVGFGLIHGLICRFANSKVVLEGRSVLKIGHLSVRGTFATGVLEAFQSTPQSPR